MSLFTVNFGELYERHLCRHSQFGINVIHILAVLGIYLCLYAIVHRFVGIAWPLVGLAAVHLVILARNLPVKVLAATGLFLAAVIALVIYLPSLPPWAYALAIYPFYKVQVWSHRIYNVERDMTEFNKKYRKGFGLFVLLSVYEVPILLHYLAFDRANRPAWLRRSRGEPQPVQLHDVPETQAAQSP